MLGKQLLRVSVGGYCEGGGRERLVREREREREKEERREVVMVA